MNPAGVLAAVRPHLRPGRWSLSTKLVATMVGLFLAVTLATASLTVLLMQDYLLKQLDRDVTSISHRAVGGPHDLADQGQVPHPDGGGPPGGGGDSLRVTLLAGTVVSSSYARGDASGALTTAQIAQLNAAGIGETPKTVHVDGLGDYRAISVRDPLGQTVISGIPITPVTDTVDKVISLVGGGTIVGFVLVTAGGLWLVRRNLAPLQRVAHTATQVSRLKLDSGDVALAERVPLADADPNTEVGQVGLALNSMLDNVEGALQARHESEQRVRQFVADASHELRTPLASIRGYAELSRREREPVPPSITHALNRVESEALRMQGLVEDLLLLARLDAGRPLDREPVDLTLLAMDAVSDAHAAAPDHRWELDLPDEPIEVTGDHARLHQVVANLLANARTHTPAGTRVTTSVSTENGWVRVIVADNGPGVPKSLQRNVFQRFTRGDDSRNRAAGSTGLGLSIVDAVARSHGGTVELTSTPGDTTFTVLLPVH
ncbi:HAMP domain-containing sensor histidine kinase [Nostocoides sp. HKS02]|uniref:HAMP domain-containing sensor histidine kinase n=1 Tax=Nostocoides sp. HKS02 TaxID=1813880 RepID=UPI0012B46BB0|nr:HAMP domain-containing sensor histidine kinase [Tetrasphaera sp. HKS02]QGN58523.1 HAMP domain-containing protein [Tetrasphaera sp. HKS02]